MTIQQLSSLYIIGNGFDIHHDIPSSYRNYLQWLQQNDEVTYNKIVELYGEEATQKEWWNEFETNLGYFDIREKVENFAFQNQPDDDDIEKMRAIDTMGGAWDAQVEIGSVVDAIKGTFHSWVDSLPKAKRAAKLKLDVKDAFFINFNYSPTLEDVYSVKPENILYIHGCLNDDEYILGHGRSYKDVSEDAEPYLAPYDGTQDPSDYGLDAIDDDITENTKKEVVSQVMSIAKPVFKILHNNQFVFDRLSNVKLVYIFGISFSDVDEPYLAKFIECVDSDAEFIISYYSKDDLINAVKFAEQYRINYRMVKLEDLQIVRQLKLEI